LEHYFEVLLDKADVAATIAGLLYKWFPIDELRLVDLRPGIIRDCIIDGSFRHVGHLLSTNEGG